jgi:DNA repair protein RadA/Sms
MRSRTKDYACIACGATHENYAAFCFSCGAGDTVTVSEDEEEEEAIGEEFRQRQRAKRALFIDSKLPDYISTGRPAWDEALGGGVVLRSSILVPGPSGVGKSTSLLRIADHIGNDLGRPVLYGSAEMPARNVRALCDRLRLSIKHLFVNDSGRFEDMYQDILELSPAVVIWDSLQRFKVDERIGLLEVRHVVRGAIEAGNHANAVTFFTSHVNKDEDFSGENGISHDVDAVVWLKKLGPNLISVECPLKNRYGPTPKSAMEKLYDDDDDIETISSGAVAHAHAH